MGPLNQQFLNGGIAAVDVLVVGLIVVGQQTLVTAGFANAVAGGPASIDRGEIADGESSLELAEVEVKDLERLAGDNGELLGTLRETAEHAGSALGGLVKQNGLPTFGIGQRLDNQL